MIYPSPLHKILTISSLLENSEFYNCYLSWHMKKLWLAQKFLLLRYLYCNFIGGQMSCPYWDTNRLPLLGDKQVALIGGQIGSLLSTSYFDIVSSSATRDSWKLAATVGVFGFRVTYNPVSLLTVRVRVASRKSRNIWEII